MKDVLASVSFCASHMKGADNGPRHPAQSHAEWLEEACLIYHESGIRTIVACTDYPGIIDVEQNEGNHQRDVLWRILGRGIQMLGTCHNPGHQVGAALCIRIGLEAAGKWDIPFLMHTAEDVMPRPGAIASMLQALRRGCDYAGNLWGPDRDQLNAQFFACRTSVIAGRWDSCQVPGDGCIERYLMRLMSGRERYLNDELYQTTHDREQWQRWKKEYE